MSTDHRLLTLRIGTDDLVTTLEDVQRMRTGLSDRRQLHARIAVEAGNLTKDYVRGLNRHKSAERLGATPSGHLQNAAKGIESDSNAAAAIVRIPRVSGLGRAFRDFNLRPTGGRKWLTLPADKRTYGRRAGEFPGGTFAFAVVGGRYPALVFRDGWTVAYWLRRSVTIKQDRTLLPSDAGYRAVAQGTTGQFIDDLFLRGLRNVTPPKTT